MKRKILICALAVGYVLSVIVIPSFAVKPSPILAHEPFEYEIPSNWYTFRETDCNGGTGWGSKWAGDNSTFTTAIAGSPKVTLTTPPISAQVHVKNDVTIYRKLASAISSSVDGEYYADVCFSTVGDAGVKWEIGFSNQISFGFDDAGDGKGIRSFIKVGKNVTYSTKTYLSGTIYNANFRISVDENGTDKVYFRAVPPGETAFNWDVKAEAQLTDLSYISINAPNSISTIVVYDICISTYDAEAVKAYEDFLNNEAVTEEDCINTLDKASLLPDCDFRDQIIAKISEIAGELDVYDITENKMKESSPENSSHVYAEDIKEISISYRYRLKSVDSIASISAGESVIDGNAAFDGKIVTVTPESPLTYNKSYTVTLNNLVSFDDSDMKENEIEFTTSIVPAIDIKDGGIYGEGKVINWLNYSGVTTIATVSIDDGDAAAFANGAQLSEEGEYVLTLYSSEDDGEKTEERKYFFIVLPAYPPEAKNLQIEGDMITGEVIEAVYDFVDKNSDSEGASLYQWYSCDTADGEYTKIALNGNAKKYTLTENDENKYLKFAVTPVADSTLEKTGKTVECEPVLGAFKPTASNVKIVMEEDEEMAEGTKLTAEFLYNDLNGNENEGGHGYLWYTKDSAGEEKVGEEETYTVSFKDFNKQIFVRVIPKTTVKPYEGEAMDSEMLYTPAKPSARNVKITGTAKEGKTIGGTYLFYDVNGDDEGGTSGYWINADSGSKIKNGHFLTLTSDMVGMKVKYVVEVKSVKAPTDGDAAESSAVTISSSGGDRRVGSGFSYSGSTSGSIKTEIKETVSETKPTEPVKPIDKDSFSDVSGHWAEESIKELNKIGLISGVNENEFAPERSVSRAEFVTMMVRLAGWEAAGQSAEFSDVDSSDWFSSAINAALEKGLISKAESFRPNDFISRSEVAKLTSIISELISFKGQNNEGISFTDKEAIPSWAEEYIEDAARKGIMLGDDKGNIRANSAMTRAEAATIMWRLNQGGMAE